MTQKGNPLLDVEAIDLTVARAAVTIKDRPIVKALGTMSEIADQPPLFTLTGAAALVGIVTGSRRLARAGIRMFLAETIATWSKAGIKKLVARTRPFVLADEGRYERSLLGPDEKKHNSFPSGHTAGAVAVSRALVREYPGAAVPAALFATSIAVVQVPRCAHYPSDITAGAIVGLVGEAVSRPLADRLIDMLGLAGEERAHGPEDCDDQKRENR